MFSNMSNQVSGLGSSLGSWFKKDGPKAAGEEGAEGQEAEAKKDQTSPQEQPSPASANASEQSVKGSADENDDAASQHSGYGPHPTLTSPSLPFSTHYFTLKKEKNTNQ